jgi:hypothetical protein
MTSVSEIAQVSRKLSRDFGTFFEVNFPSLGTTLRLPHPLVEQASVDITSNEDGSAVTDFTVMSRQGLLKLDTPYLYPQGVFVTGTFYQWFLEEDLEFFAEVVAAEHIANRTRVTLEDITGPEVEVMGIGALVQALWSLLAEFATDIDVSSPEGISIPAHQRFQQTQALIQYWQSRYDEKAALLNVGLKKIEAFTLRRVSRLSNRLVPVYRPRELDDLCPPVRVRPPIDPIVHLPSDEEEETCSASDSWGIGWTTLGTGSW